jgi:hypothetical protein
VRKQKKINEMNHVVIVLALCALKAPVGIDKVSRTPLARGQCTTAARVSYQNHRRF